MSNRLKIKKKYVSKIAINRECFLLVDIVAEKGRIIKRGQVIYVVDAFIEGNAVVIAFKYKGIVVEAPFYFSKKIPKLTKYDFESMIINDFVFPVLTHGKNSIVTIKDGITVEHEFMYSAPVLD